MTKNFNFALKIKGGGVVGRVAHAKSSDPATPPPKKKNLERAPGYFAANFSDMRICVNCNF